MVNKPKRARLERRRIATERRKAEVRTKKSRETKTVNAGNQTESSDRALAEPIENLARTGVSFIATSEQSRRRCRELYLENETQDESVLRLLLDGLVADFAIKTTQKIESADETISWQLSVSASFIRTYYVVGRLILDGDLVEASVLLRKQLEAITRLQELDKHPPHKLFGSTPNVKNTVAAGGEYKQAVGRLYGYLSGIAHSGNPNFGTLLTPMEQGDKIGPSLQPQYSEQSRGLNDLQVFLALLFLSWFAQSLAKWYPDLKLDFEWRMLVQAFGFARKTGAIQAPELEKDGL